MDADLVISTWNRPFWTRLARDGLVLVGIIWFVYGLVAYRTPALGDAYDYWSVRSDDPYTGTLGNVVNFAYPPPAAAVFVALGHVPLSWFLLFWTVMNIGLAAWLIAPQPRLGLILALPLADALVTGQIELLMAAAIVVSFRRPSTWAIPALTKPTAGLGLAWFAARREWRQLAMAAMPLAVVTGLSVLLWPAWWQEWFAFLARSEGQDHELLPLRLVIAIALVGWGALTERRWTVLVAAVVALPVIYIHSLAMLLGLARLRSPSGAPAPAAAALAESSVALA